MPDGDPFYFPAAYPAGGGGAFEHAVIAGQVGRQLYRLFRPATPAEQEVIDGLEFTP